MQMVATKDQARQHGRRVRDGLSPDAKRRLDAQIIRRCQLDLDWPAYNRVHLYLPIAPRGEIDTWQLVTWIWRNQPHISVYAPRMLAETVEHVPIDTKTSYVTSLFGICEPAPRHPGEAETAGFDLVIVPLLACDHRGQRVGYGDTFYERFLRNATIGRKVGLIYGAARMPVIETWPGDSKLDALISEHEIEVFA